MGIIVKSANVFLLAASLLATSAGVNAQMLKKSAEPAAPSVAPMPAPMPAPVQKPQPGAALENPAKVTPAPAVKSVTPARSTQAVKAPSVVAPKPVVAKPAAPAYVSISSTLRNAARDLTADLADAKTNADALRVVAAADLKLAKALGGDVLQDTKTINFSEAKDPVSNFFGQIFKQQQTSGSGSSSTVKDSVMLASQLRFRGVIDADSVAAAAEYAVARGEKVSLVVYARTDAALLEATSQKLIDGNVIKGVSPRIGEPGILLVSEAPLTREIAQYTARNTNAIAGATSPGSAAPGKAAVAQDSQGNWPELCPDENFLTKSFCQAKMCNEQASLAQHPTCVNFKETQQSRGGV